MNRFKTLSTCFVGACLSSLLLVTLPRASAAQSATPDSTAREDAPADSLVAEPASLGSEAIQEIDLWARPISRTVTDGERRPTTLAQALRARASMRLRESGDPGARAFLSLSPIDNGAPEIFVDGVPTRSPADVLPSIYDQSYAPLRALRASDARWDVGGPFALHAELDQALEGRTRLRSHFAAMADESYYRGLSWSTPRAPRTLRLDFEEWKTEDGYDSFALENEPRPQGFGRAKQRRFELTGQARTRAGTLALRFGRGRRFHDGQLLGATPEDGAVERWTGTVIAGIDRGDEGSHTRLRLFHLDWQDVDETHGGQTRDAARLGFRAQRNVMHAGWSWMLQAERQSVAFEDADALNTRPAPVYVGRVAVGHDGGVAWRRGVRAELVGSDATSERFDVAGSVDLHRDFGRARLSVGAERRPRLPTLMESGGRWETDFADGLHRYLLGGGELQIERQDRVHVGVAGELKRLSWGVVAEHWWLSRGIGWEVVSDSEARYVGGAELSTPAVRVELRREFGRVRRGFSMEAEASHLLDAPSVDGNRGAGWPRSWAGVSLSVWSRLFHDHNRLSLHYSLRATGERFDDLLSPFAPGASSTVLPRESRHDLRFALRIRDAELYLLWENLADATLQEISASRLRGRQRVWGLYWNFYN